jgi:hypothetical protein
MSDTSTLAPCAMCGAPACDQFSICGHTTCECTSPWECQACEEEK